MRAVGSEFDTHSLMVASLTENVSNAVGDTVLHGARFLLCSHWFVSELLDLIPSVLVGTSFHHPRFTATTHGHSDSDTKSATFASHSTYFAS